MYIARLRTLVPADPGEPATGGVSTPPQVVSMPETPGQPPLPGAREEADHLMGRQEVTEIADVVRDTFGVACRNPVLAGERARKREDLMQATEELLAPVAARVAAGRLTGSAAIGVKVGEVISRYKMAKHFDVTVTDHSRSVTSGRSSPTTRTCARLPQPGAPRQGHVLICMPAAVPVLTEPASRQKQAFDLIAAPMSAILRKYPETAAILGAKAQASGGLGTFRPRNFGLERSLASTASWAW